MPIYSFKEGKSYPDANTLDISDKWNKLYTKSLPHFTFLKCRIFQCMRIILALGHLNCQTIGIALFKQPLGGEHQYFTELEKGQVLEYGLVIK